MITQFPSVLLQMNLTTLYAAPMQNGITLQSQSLFMIWPRVPSNAARRHAACLYARLERYRRHQYHAVPYPPFEVSAGIVPQHRSIIPKIGLAAVIVYGP